MIKNYDQEFGPGGCYTWPDDLNMAERFIRAALCAKSSPDCFYDDFFYGDEEVSQYQEDEALELAEAVAKRKQELFIDARNWPLLYVVASAVYHILSTKAENTYVLTRFWYYFFWLFLSFDEPLFDMLKAKGWDKIYKKEIREGFKSRLWYEIRGLTGNELMWGNDKDQPWLTCRSFASHIYPEDVLRCLDLVGIDPDLAHSAVDKVFKSQSLTPLYDVLSDDPSSMPATVVKGSHKGEEGEAGSPKKPSAGLRIHVLHFTSGALLFAVAAMAFTRSRSPRSYWNSIPLAQIIQSNSAPCFASASFGRSNLNAQTERSRGRRQEGVAGTSAFASHQGRSRPVLAIMNDTIANLNRSI